ncbi:MAG: hypothetical protein Q4A30_02490 [Candidatus Saccharibacteria bacterium]|nr:hypothetical protein [Candidatus Saccharibacteria bacterium]
MILTMEDLRKFDLGVRSDAVVLKGVTPTTIEELELVNKDECLKMVFTKLKEDGIFFLKIWLARILEGYLDKQDEEAVLGVKPRDSILDRYQTKQGLYVLLENGCLFELLERKVVLISEIEKKIKTAQSEVRKGFREHWDSLEGQWFEYRVCGRIEIRNVSPYEMTGTDKLTKFIQSQMIDELKTKKFHAAVCAELTEI